MSAGQGVFTPELRFKFVKGWLTGGSDPEDGSVECGHGTAYPLEVTREQLEEIAYRVKTCALIEGSIQSQVFDEPDSLVEVVGTAPASIVTIEEYDETAPSIRLTARGYYHSWDGVASDEITDTQAAFFVDETSITLDPVDDFEAVGIQLYKNLENGMWAVNGSHLALVNNLLWFEVFNSGLSGTSPTPFGFSHLTASASSEPANYGLVNSLTFEEETNYGAVASSLSSDLTVAWIDEDETGNPFSSGNRMFLRMEFRLSFRLIGVGWIETYDSINNPSFPETSPFNVVIRMPSGDLTFPVYQSAGFDLPATASDFVFEATSWWPYAKDNPAVPVWDTATGAKL
jgi:hypothetical protein